MRPILRWPGLALLVVTALFVGPGHAQSDVPGAAPVSSVAAGDAGPFSTIQRARREGRIRLGVRDVSLPFSFKTGDRYSGYSVDLCLAIVDEIRQQSGLSGLQVEFVEVSSRNRIPKLLAGDIDLECGSTSHTDERARFVAFSSPIFVVSITALVQDPGIRDLAQIDRRNDAGGGPVALTSGTTALGALERFERSYKLAFERLVVDGHEEALQALMDGRAMAFVLDDVLLAAAAARLRHDGVDGAGQLRLLGGTLKSDAYALMLRRGDESFRKLVNRVVAEMKQTGRLEKLYEKWFTQPIRERGGLNLGFPLSAENQRILRDANAAPLLEPGR